jgi:hypothetical protein
MKKSTKKPAKKTAKKPSLEKRKAKVVLARKKPVRSVKARAAAAAAPQETASGWFELKDAFLDKGGYEPLCGLNGKPVYVAGKVGNLVIVNIPAGTDMQSARALRKALTAEGASVLIVTDEVKFLRAVRVADSELEKHLDDEADRQAQARRESPGPEAAEETADGSGSVADGTGSGDPQPDPNGFGGEALADEGSSGSGETHADP